MKFLSMLVLVSLTAAAANVKCRCPTTSETTLYSARKSPGTLQAETSYSTVLIDAKGYYIINNVRVLPSCKEEEVKNPFWFDLFGGGRRRLQQFTANAHRDNNVFSRSFLRQVAAARSSSEGVFDCDASVIAQPPTDTSLASRSLEQLVTLHLATNSPQFYTLDNNNKLVLTRNPSLSLYSTDNRLLESKIPCKTVPASLLTAVASSRSPAPFHCHCPEGTDPEYLPADCLGSTLLTTSR